MRFLLALFLMCVCLTAQGNIIQVAATNPSGFTTLNAFYFVGTTGITSYTNDYLQISVITTNPYALCGYIMSANTFYGGTQPGYLSAINPGIITPLDQVGYFSTYFDPYVHKLTNILGPSYIGNIYYIQMFEVTPYGGFPVSVSDQFMFVT